MERKEFIRISGRWLILGLIAVFTGGLVVKKQISTEKAACSKSTRCMDCTVLSSCTLPEAVKLRNDEKDKGI